MFCAPFAGFGTATARRRSRRGERRGVGGVGQEPPRTPARRRRGARGAGPAVRRTGDRGRTEAEQDGRRVAPLHPDQRSPARKLHYRIGFGGRTASHARGGRRADGRGVDPDQRTRRRPRVLRGRGGLVRPAWRRPLGGVHPLRAAVGRSPYRIRLCRRRHRRRIRAGRRSRRDHNEIQDDVRGPGRSRHDRTHPPRPAGRRDRTDRDGVTSLRSSSIPPTSARSPKSG